MLPDPVSDCETVPVDTETRDAPCPPDHVKTTLVGVILPKPTFVMAVGASVKVPVEAGKVTPPITGAILTVYVAPEYLFSSVNELVVVDRTG